MFTRTFWKDTAERVVSSAAGGALAAIPIEGHIELRSMAIGAGATALVSFLKALLASRVNDPQSASFVDTPGRHAAPDA